MKPVHLSLMLLLCFFNNPLFAQSCDQEIKASTPTRVFSDNQNDTVTDKRTDLRWARCTLGQVLDKGACRGEAHFLPWAIASLVIEPGWRLPTIAELNSLVELSCINPAINNTLFPDTIPGAYWSATRFINTDGNYWQVNFLHGESTSEPADTLAFVRLVRDEP